jgi:TRAP-type C4-dicarboxylate transport system permease small subunit
MTAFLRAYSAAMSILARLALWLAGLGILTMLVFVAWLVVGRVILNDSPTWTEPAVLLLMSWFILLGAAAGVRGRIHLNFEIGLHVAPPPVRFAMQVFNECVVLAFGGAMAWYGGLLAHGTWSDRTPMLGVSKGWDYVPMVIGGVLVALFAFERLLQVLARTPEAVHEADVIIPSADGA